MVQQVKLQNEVNDMFEPIEITKIDQIQPARKFSTHTRRSSSGVFSFII
jgi:hypothetical protein